MPLDKEKALKNQGFKQVVGWRTMNQPHIALILL